MKRILLANSDEVALVDDKFYTTLCKYTWYEERGYAYTYHGGTSHSMHKCVYRLAHGKLPQAGLHIDHANRKRLDNRLCNLRLIDSVSNMYNRSKRCDSQQEYKGVQQRKGTDKYRARIKYTVDGVKHEEYSQFTLTRIDAAIYYNILSAKYHGDFSVGNTVTQLHELYYPQLAH